MLDSRLKHAVAVGRLCSFSRAADDVGVTQSAVVKSVADLERQLGYPLFHRTSRGARLTGEGRGAIDRASRLLSDAAELVGDATPDQHR
jgi:DNA-binding transcriptional LysR family regulator